MEEFYPVDPACDPRSAPLADLVELYLRILRSCGTRCTFFVVGEVARRFPDLVQAIAAAGHEVGCHGDKHITIDQLTPATFAADLRANRAAVEAATGMGARGFRAPLLSLTERTSWAYAVLASEGFTYSSSVLPGRNPLYGWPEFGVAPRSIDGVFEIPVTLARISVLGSLPIYSGTYFRVLPWWLVHRLLPSPPQLPLVSYFHPYDIDHHQPWIMHSGVKGNLIMNLLLFLRRGSLPSRIERLLRACPRGHTYRDFVDSRCLTN